MCCNKSETIVLLRRRLLGRVQTKHHSSWAQNLSNGTHNLGNRNDKYFSNRSDHEIKLSHTTARSWRSATRMWRSWTIRNWKPQWNSCVTTTNNTSFTLIMTPGTRRARGDICVQMNRFSLDSTCAYQEPWSVGDRKDQTKKKIVWFKWVARSGTGLIEPEKPRETLLVCRESVAQSNQRNSPCWCEPNNELKKRPKLNNSLFMCANRLMCFSPSNPSPHHSKHSKDSPDENVPWHLERLSDVLVYFSLLFYLFVAFSQTAFNSQSQFSTRRPKTLSLSLDCLIVLLMLCLSLRWTHQRHCHLYCYGWVELHQTQNRPFWCERVNEFERVTLNEMANRQTTHPNGLLSIEKHFQKWYKP